MSKSTSTNMAVVSILKFSVKYTVSRSEKYHLVDLLLNLILNLLVHHPIPDHYHHLDFLVKLLVHHPIHDHLQAKICHFVTFKQIKNKNKILGVACVRVADVRK